MEDGWRRERGTSRAAVRAAPPRRSVITTADAIRGSSSGTGRVNRTGSAAFAATITSSAAVKSASSHSDGEGGNPAVAAVAGAAALSTPLPRPLGGGSSGGCRGSGPEASPSSVKAAVDVSSLIGGEVGSGAPDWEAGGVSVQNVHSDVNWTDRTVNPETSACLLGYSAYLLGYSAYLLGYSAYLLGYSVTARRGL